MRYLRLDKVPTDAPLPFARCYAEIGERRWVTREIGLDGHDRVVYKYPWHGSPSSFRGIWSLATFGESPDDLTQAEFDALWVAPLEPMDQESSIRAIRGPSLRERLRGLLARHRPPAS